MYSHENELPRAVFEPMTFCVLDGCSYPLSYQAAQLYICSIIIFTCTCTCVSLGESLLLNPDPSYSSPRTSPVVDACSIKALFMDLDGPMLNYQPLFDENTIAAVS